MCLVACGRVSFDPVDGGTAGGNDTPDGTSTYCDTVPPGYAVCSDFDTAPLGTDGPSMIVRQNGVLDLGDVVESPPFSMWSRFDAEPSAGVISAAALEYTRATMANGMRLESSIYMPVRPQSVTYEFNAL